jgi:hypothetical protein
MQGDARGAVSRVIAEGDDQDDDDDDVVGVAAAAHAHAPSVLNTAGV